MIELVVGGKPVRVEIERSASGTAARIDGRPAGPRILRLLPDGALLSIDGRTVALRTARAGGRIWVHVGGSVFVFEEAGGADEMVRGGSGAAGGDSVVSAMPGLLVKVLVELGQEVARGEPLVIVEAMKMETPLLSPAAGRVKKIHYEKGALVEAGKPIVEIEPRAEEA